MLDEKIIIFEDDNLLIINKPAGILTVPTPKKEKYTLTSCINLILKQRNSHEKALPCHRLDRDTSGLIIYVKSQVAHQRVMKQFKNGQVKKKYIAFVQGNIKRSSGIMSFPIENKKAITKYKLVQRRKGYSIIMVEPTTGRTNQIRIHFKIIGHPVLGERKFAFGKDFNIKFKRVALHALEVKFRHPVSGKTLCFSSKLPDDMNRLIGSLMKPKFMEQSEHKFDS